MASVAAKTSTGTRLFAAFDNRSPYSSSGSTSSGEFPGGEPARGAAAASGVAIAIEPGPSNSRCIWAGVDIAAPASAVYATLTAYEDLGTFIPGLAENRCLERYADGCKLLQVGRQDLALGLQFRARCCLRITEHPEGMPRRVLARSPNSRPSSSGGSSSEGRNGGNGGGGGGAWWNPLGGLGNARSSSRSNSDSAPSSSASSSGSSGDEEQQFSEQRYLCPRSPLGSAGSSDISFQLIDGDFAAFKGLWRVQAAGPGVCRLSYTLFVRPQPWLLVALIEQRIAGEIGNNLAAVKGHVERQVARGRL